PFQQRSWRGTLSLSQTVFKAVSVDRDPLVSLLVGDKSPFHSLIPGRGGKSFVATPRPWRRPPWENRSSGRVKSIITESGLVDRKRHIVRSLARRIAAAAVGTARGTATRIRHRDLRRTNSSNVCSGDHGAECVHHRHGCVGLRRTI